MYLSKRNYVKRWEHKKPEEQYSVLVKKGDAVDTLIKPERVSYVVEEVAYWRKANQVHSWFVANVQDGVDNCGNYYVSHEKLQELVDLCKTVLSASHLVEGKVKNGERWEDGQWVPIMQDGKVIEQTATAEILLPTAPGFFFGGTDYDEYYYADLKQTVEMLQPELDADKGGDYEYHSSW